MRNLRPAVRVFLFTLVLLGLVAHICELPVEALAPMPEAASQHGSGHDESDVHADASCEAIRPLSMAPTVPVGCQRVAVPGTSLRVTPVVPAPPVAVFGSPPLYLVHSALLI